MLIHQHISRPGQLWPAITIKGSGKKSINQDLLVEAQREGRKEPQTLSYKSRKAPESANFMNENAWLPQRRTGFLNSPSLPSY